MEWKGRRQSSNVEDRRGQRTGGGSPFGRGGIRLPSGGGMRSARGGGLSGIIMLVVLFFVLKACGIDPMAILAGDPGVTGGGSSRSRRVTTTSRSSFNV